MAIANGPLRRRNANVRRSALSVPSSAHAPYLPFTIRVGRAPETLRMNNSYRCGPQSAPQPEIKPFGATAGENPPRMA
jgi:hypothetical protein